MNLRPYIIWFANGTSSAQYINCSWPPPFSLVSIPVYIINVTYGGELVTQNTTYSTTWQYCPSQFDTYTISVVGNNSAWEVCHIPHQIVHLLNMKTDIVVLNYKLSY